MQLPLDALGRRIIYCQIVHENRFGGQLVALCRPPPGILEAYSTGTQGLSGVWRPYRGHVLCGKRERKAQQYRAYLGVI